jgi:hypothetical protein
MSLHGFGRSSGHGQRRSAHAVVLMFWPMGPEGGVGRTVSCWIDGVSALPGVLVFFVLLRLLLVGFSALGNALLLGPIGLVMRQVLDERETKKRARRVAARPGQRTEGEELGTGHAKFRGEAGFAKRESGGGFYGRLTRSCGGVRGRRYTIRKIIFW